MLIQGLLLFAGPHCGCLCLGIMQSSLQKRWRSGLSLSATAATSSMTPLTKGAVQRCAMLSHICCQCKEGAIAAAHLCGLSQALCCQVHACLHARAVPYVRVVHRFRGCLVDEHYYGTLFAMHNRHEETDCKGVLTVAEFRCVMLLTHACTRAVLP